VLVLRAAVHDVLVPKRRVGHFCIQQLAEPAYLPDVQRPKIGKKVLVDKDAVRGEVVEVAGAVRLR
jgi:hypothetical protein